LAYRIEYSPATDEHLRALTARQRSLVFDSVDDQLKHRKPMRPNPLAPWELRAEELRVHHDVTVEPEGIVTILAVGIKDRSRIIIGGEEVEL